MSGNKYLTKIAQVIETEKQAGLLNSVKSFASKAGKAIMGDAKAIPAQATRLKEAWKLRGTGSRNTIGNAVGSLAKNRAVQAGAGALGAAALVGRATKSDND